MHLWVPGSYRWLHDFCNEPCLMLAFYFLVYCLCTVISPISIKLFTLQRNFLEVCICWNVFNILAPLFVFLSDDTSCSISLRELYDEALGIAKLPGFYEWLSIHPIITELGGEEMMEASHSCHKMIIFAHHHIVLDGVQVNPL